MNYVPNPTMQFVAKSADPVRTDSGLLALTPTNTFADADQPDALLVPGGPSALAMSKNPELLQWAQGAAREAT